MVELPTGTVTFLFTDIEGSTRLLQSLGGHDYGRVQDDHGAILRKAIAAGRGVEVRTEGDSFFAVFLTPADALSAAVRAQRDLVGHAWPDDVTVRVRMGLHTGEGVLGAGGAGYVGIDVNRAARIAAAGHGGQVLLSHATRGLVEHSLPGGVSLRELGLHRLKDIDHPEQLHDLVIHGLPSDFPPVKSLDFRPTNLPLQRTSFVGRERETAEIAEFLGGTRLLTLTGAGGTGKTRLALKVAADLLDRFPHGVFLVDLSAVTNPALVLPEVAAALRVREEPGRDLIDTLIDHLRDRTMLLVMDNFEQLVDAAPAMGYLVDAAPQLTILATSRVPLHIAGEHEYHVRPLPLPSPRELDDPARLAECESVALFVQRAAAVRAGFRITEETAAAVAEITARLDGLPLALELAASRVKILSPSDLAARLEQRLRLLTGGPHDLPERQRTLRGTIQWSYDLLDAEERLLFARLAAFAGGWTLNAAEAICGPDVDLEVLAGLTSLVDGSLVQMREGSDGRMRFGLLETVREYAGERLVKSGEEDAIRSRHAEYFRALAEEAEPHLTGEAQARWVQFFEREHDNVRTALDWAEERGDVETALRTASALWRFWQQRGHLAEGRARLERLITLPGASRRDAVRVRVLGALGGVAFWQHDYETMRHAYEEAAEIARELGDARLLSHALFDLSFVPMTHGADFARMEHLLRQSLEYADENDRFLAARIWTGLGYVEVFRGNPKGAVEPIQRGTDIHREAGHRLFIGENLISLAGLAFLAGDGEEATDHLREGVRVLAKTESPLNFAQVLIPLAFEANYNRHYRRGARLMGAWVRSRVDFGGSPPTIAHAHFGDPEADARAALGAEEYERAWAEGYAMTNDESVAYALEYLD